MASSPDAEHAPLGHTRVFLRPIASPFALGFVGLAGATFTFSGLELGWIGLDEQLAAGLIILLFAPLLQVIAAVFGFLARDPVAATGMGILAGSWLSIGVVLIATEPGADSEALGVFLFVPGAALLAVGATALQGGKLVPAAVIGTTGVRFILTAIFEVSGVEGWQDAAAVVGIVLAAMALYAAASLELEDLQRRAMLPTLRRAKARAALDAGYAEQMEQVGTEAGVRHQL